MPMYELSMERNRREVKVDLPYDRQVEEMNRQKGLPTLYVNAGQQTLSESQFTHYFSYIDSLTVAINRTKTTRDVHPLLIRRAIAYGMIQNYESAIDDLSSYIYSDSTSAIAYWQRAVYQSKANAFHASEGTDVSMKKANVIADLSEAIKYNPKSPYLYYNRGNSYAERKDYKHAVDDYTQAIALDAHLAEAYYNRGLMLVRLKKVDEAIANFSKAGELGLYQAYSVIKKYREK